MKCEHRSVSFDEHNISKVKCGPGGKYPGEIIKYMWVCTECQSSATKHRKKKIKNG